MKNIYAFSIIFLSNNANINHNTCLTNNNKLILFLSFYLYIFFIQNIY